MAASVTAGRVRTNGSLPPIYGQRHDSAAGFAELTAMLADAGDTEPAPIPVAIETSRAPGRGVAIGRPVDSIMLSLPLPRREPTAFNQVVAGFLNTETAQTR